MAIGTFFEYLIESFDFFFRLGFSIRSHHFWSMFVSQMAFVAFFGLEKNLAFVASEQGHIVYFVFVSIPMCSRRYNLAAELTGTASVLV